MREYPVSRKSIVGEVIDSEDAIAQGKKLREKGFRFHTHPIWPNSISIPSGEAFDDERLKTRYSMVENKEELDEGKKYLVLCEEFLVKESDVSRGYRL